LRKLGDKEGVRFARRASGHASSKHIGPYVMPSDEETEQAIEGLF
jgi:hypothetical protein